MSLFNCGHSPLVDECLACYNARWTAHKERLLELERAAEVDCPTHARPGICATRGDHPVGWCSIHDRRREICRNLLTPEHQIR